jgi:hypothetical protein
MPIHEGLDLLYESSVYLNLFYAIDLIDKMLIAKNQWPIRLSRLVRPKYDYLNILKNSCKR